MVIIFPLLIFYLSMLVLGGAFFHQSDKKKAELDVDVGGEHKSDEQNERKAIAFSMNFTRKSPSKRNKRKLIM